ncbi:MAG: PEP/pyruvate-binding domain-containing protein, partial [Rhodocyclaceae bacterium]|nr:PEP/pyruvate-binding domain-containing protein [Rhodocyclaceae bacterium]
IPFGAFRAFLEQPMPGTGMSAHAWLRAEYRRIDGLPAAQRAVEAQRLRERLRNWIGTADPGAAFRAVLARAMQERFGPDGSYAVFVRSDTNVEDLPGFSGAGLNLTVPNVAGLDEVVAAILRVWASPFAERAFAWRQMRMDAPEHVYVSVLLQRAVPVDKSGVMVTLDLESGSPAGYTVAANEGVGGAVAGQAAEELLIVAATGEVRLLAEASATIRRVLVAGGGLGGGLENRPVSGQPVLTPDEIEQLRRLGQELPERFPQRDESGQGVPADVEFGFVAGRLALFQIRPYLQSRQARRDRFLLELDAPLRAQTGRSVTLRGQ